MDIFIEHRVLRKKETPEILKIAGITLAGIVVFIVVFLLAGTMPKVAGFAFMLEIGVAYLWWYLISSLNVEFEYALTNGEMDVDKVIAKRKRRRLVTVNLRNIEVMAPVNSPDHKREFENTNVKTRINASASPTAPDAYFLVVSTEKTGMTRLIFTPNQKILDGAAKVAPRKVFFS